MKKLKTSDITSSIGMPIKSGSLDHIQNAYIESFDALAKKAIGINYTTTKAYVLYGCINSGSGSTYTISAGAVFYQGEIYLVPAASFTTSGGNVPIATITTTYFTAANADPVSFTDSSSKNVHEIRQMVIASGAVGSGTIAYSNFIFDGWYTTTTTTFTQLGLGTTTSISNVCVYYKNGDMVTAHFSISLSGAVCTTSQYAIKFLLPIAADTSFSWIGQGFIYTSAALTAGINPYIGTLFQINSTFGNTYCKIQLTNAATATMALDSIYGTITYKVG